MDGFIIINKPTGITSHDVCEKLKRILNTKKVGHTGTLDPLASGVVVNAVGKATKLIQYLENQKKTYVATLCFGIETDTYDILGKVVNKKETINLDLSAIDSALEKLKDSKSQIPPIYSAIKVKGRKLYDYALKNEEVIIKPRPIKIDSLKRVSNLYLDENGLQSIKIEIKANKGFYVRSLIHDLGIMLDTFATMTALVRTEAGSFKIEEANSLDDVNYRCHTIEETFGYLDRIDVSDYMAKLIKNGVVLDERQYNKNNLFKVYNNNKLIAIYAPCASNNYKIIVYLGDENGNI